MTNLISGYCGNIFHRAASTIQINPFSSSFRENFQIAASCTTAALAAVAISFLTFKLLQIGDNTLRGVNALINTNPNLLTLSNIRAFMRSDDIYTERFAIGLHTLYQPE